MFIVLQVAVAVPAATARLHIEAPIDKQVVVEAQVVWHQQQHLCLVITR
jgi:hypothetical protein